MSGKLCVMMIGNSGRGKSTLGNILLGADKLPVSADGKPCTTTISSNLTTSAFEVIDTPGFGDTEQKTIQEHLTAIVAVGACAFNPMHAILWFPPSFDRANASLQRQIERISHFFEQKVWENVIIIARGLELEDQQLRQILKQAFASARVPEPKRPLPILDFGRREKKTRN